MFYELFDLNQMICVAMLIGRMYNGCNYHRENPFGKPVLTSTPPSLGEGEGGGVERIDLFVLDSQESAKTKKGG